MTAPAKRSPTPGRHVYDAIVFGGQLSGVLTTALLARHGLHVLLVPHDGMSAPYVHGDWRLPHLAFVMPPLREIPLLEEQLLALGVTTNVHRLVRAPPLQLIEPKRRFERSPDEAARTKELTRALGAGAEAFDAAWLEAVEASTASDPFFQTHPDLPPEGFFASWRFKRMLAKVEGLDQDTPLEATSMLRGLLPWAAPVVNAGPLTRARALGHLLDAPTVFPGGREGLLTLLQERARELGADVLLADEAVQLLSFDGGTAAGVRLTRTETIYKAPVLVAACDLDVLVKLVPEARQRQADKVLSRVLASKALFTLNAVVPEKALPRGLGELALVQSEAFDGGVALLQVSPARTAGDADSPDHRVLTVTVPAPIQLRAGGEPAIRSFIGTLWSALDELLPFTRKHAVVESTPWLDAPAVAAGRGEPWPLFSVPDDAWLGVSALTTGSPWKHLLIANRQVLPGLGIEGEALAAGRAVKQIEATLKKADPLKARKPA
ncbi:MAG: desaturase [Myxococcota bacterium]